MFGGLCGPMGLAGWLVMGVVWTGFIALVVWAIARLFPRRPAPPPSPAEGSPTGASATAVELGSGALPGGIPGRTSAINVGGRR